jgi:chromosome segregation ATPase
MLARRSALLFSHSTQIKTTPKTSLREFACHNYTPKEELENAGHEIEKIRKEVKELEKELCNTRTLLLKVVKFAKPEAELRKNPTLWKAIKAEEKKHMAHRNEENNEALQQAKKELAEVTNNIPKNETTLVELIHAHNKATTQAEELGKLIKELEDAKSNPGFFDPEETTNEILRRFKK